MRRITILMAFAIAMALGVATPAAANLTELGQSNVSDVTQGGPEADGGDAEAVGGDGGDAKAGGLQVLNGNAVGVALGLDDSQAGARGGDTSVESGDGGNGGDAGAQGGDAEASSGASVEQHNKSDDGGDCGCSFEEEGSPQGNEAGIEQGSPEADGGDAEAVGGDGGDAKAGGLQVLNGNAVGVALGLDDSQAGARGGDTSVESGDGGNGGDAGAQAGDAEASNSVGLKQRSTLLGKGGPIDSCLCWFGGERGSSQSNLAKVLQGSPEADGGDAEAVGGDGGDAKAGGLQVLNGNAVGVALGLDDSQAGARGGDTSVESGDGGNGGDAGAQGGDAEASNYLGLRQSNLLL